MRFGNTIPGKVLFYGGYSVLVPNHISLSIAVVDENRKGVTYNWKHGPDKVYSPQFGIDGLPEDELVTIAFKTTKDYLKNWGWESTSISLNNSPIFGRPGVKSGLGSSAASTVAVVSGLFESQGYHPYAHVETINKLSQIAYAAYSKKTGSGYDIATASFRNTIIYKRPYEFQSINEPWKGMEIIPVKLNAHIQIFNIKSRFTNTISAVKAWKVWREKEPTIFRKLMVEQDNIEKQAISYLLEGNWEYARDYTHKARDIHLKMQKYIMRYVENFEPIEPPEITRFIEEAEKRYDVIGRAPGAGGYDSVAFLTKKPYPILEVAKELNLNVEEIKVKIL